MVYSQDELDKPRESPWGKTNREQKEGLEFNIAEYQTLRDYAGSLGLDFIVSCWDNDSITGELKDTYGVYEENYELLEPYLDRVTVIKNKYPKG